MRYGYGCREPVVGFLRSLATDLLMQIPIASNHILFLATGLHKMPACQALTVHPIISLFQDHKASYSARQC